MRLYFTYTQKHARIYCREKIKVSLQAFSFLRFIYKIISSFFSVSVFFLFAFLLFSDSTFNSFLYLVLFLFRMKKMLFYFCQFDVRCCWFVNLPCCLLLEKNPVGVRDRNVSNCEKRGNIKILTLGFFRLIFFLLSVNWKNTHEVIRSPYRIAWMSKKDRKI